MAGSRHSEVVDELKLDSSLAAALHIEKDRDALDSKEAPLTLLVGQAAALLKYGILAPLKNTIIKRDDAWNTKLNLKVQSFLQAIDGLAKGNTNLDALEMIFTSHFNDIIGKGKGPNARPRLLANIKIYLQLVRFYTRLEKNLRQTSPTSTSSLTASLRKFVEVLHPQILKVKNDPVGDYDKMEKNESALDALLKQTPALLAQSAHLEAESQATQVEPNPTRAEQQRTLARPHLAPVEKLEEKRSKDLTVYPVATVSTSLAHYSHWLLKQLLQEMREIIDDLEGESVYKNVHAELELIRNQLKKFTQATQKDIDQQTLTILYVDKFRDLQVKLSNTLFDYKRLLDEAYLGATESQVRELKSRTLKMETARQRVWDIRSFEKDVKTLFIEQRKQNSGCTHLQLPKIADRLLNGNLVNTEREMAPVSKWISDAQTRLGKGTTFLKPIVQKQPVVVETPTHQPEKKRGDQTKSRHPELGSQTPGEQKHSNSKALIDPVTTRGSVSDSERHRSSLPTEKVSSVSAMTQSTPASARITTGGVAYAHQNLYTQDPLEVKFNELNDLILDTYTTTYLPIITQPKKFIRDIIAAIKDRNVILVKSKFTELCRTLLMLDSDFQMKESDQHNSVKQALESILILKEDVNNWDPSMDPKNGVTYLDAKTIASKSFSPENLLLSAAHRSSLGPKTVAGLPGQPDKSQRDARSLSQEDTRQHRPSSSIDEANSISVRTKSAQTNTWNPNNDTKVPPVLAKDEGIDLQEAIAKQKADLQQHLLRNAIRDLCNHLDKFEENKFSENKSVSARTQSTPSNARISTAGRDDKSNSQRDASRPSDSKRHRSSSSTEEANSVSVRTQSTPASARIITGEVANTNTLQFEFINNFKEAMKRLEDNTADLSVIGPLCNSIPEGHPALCVAVPLAKLLELRVAVSEERSLPLLSNIPSKFHIIEGELPKLKDPEVYRNELNNWSDQSLESIRKHREMVERAPAPRVYTPPSKAQVAIASGTAVISGAGSFFLTTLAIAAIASNPAGWAIGATIGITIAAAATVAAVATAALALGSIGWLIAKGHSYWKNRTKQKVNEAPALSNTSEKSFAADCGESIDKRNSMRSESFKRSEKSNDRTQSVGSATRSSGISRWSSDKSDSGSESDVKRNDSRATSSPRSRKSRVDSVASGQQVNRYSSTASGEVGSVAATSPKQSSRELATDVTGSSNQRRRSSS